MISRVTGDPLPGDTLLNPNNTGPDFDVYGTDLGLMWHMDGNRVGMFFGDTSGEGFVVNKNGGKWFQLAFQRTGFFIGYRAYRRS